MTGEPLELSALEALARAWADAWVGRTAFGNCCTPDVQYEDPVVLEPTNGVEHVGEHAGRLRKAFPDARVERTAQPIGSGRYACLPWRLLGTHRGELAGVSGTGRFVILHGVHYVELADGRIRRARGFFDLYDAGTQLGLLPERGGVGETALLLLRGFGLRPKA